MIKSKAEYKKILRLIYNLLDPIIDPFRLIGATKYITFFKDLFEYSKIKGAEPIRFINLYPRICEKTQTQISDIQYFYQNIWTFKKGYESRVEFHVDVGSDIDFVGFLTTITKVTFIDIRPLSANLENFEMKKGSILSLPFENNSISSLSCLHVAEHVGLGRYGDFLDPHGTKKACKELSRVLARNGNLYFSLPVGKSRLCFNAHRIHNPEQILDYFKELKLIEFSGVDDKGNFLRNIKPRDLSEANYACGMFWFKR